MKPKNIVGENIRKYRTETGITQEELALRSGLSQGYVNQLEYGKRKYTQKSLELIANALSRPVKEFFNEDGIEKMGRVAEISPKHFRRKSFRKEFMAVLNDLPEAVVEHYLTLLRLEKDLLRSGRRT